jgi:hypothetical protein
MKSNNDTVFRWVAVCWFLLLISSSPSPPYTLANNLVL